MSVRNGLPTGWEARLGLNGRIYYHSKRSQIVQILPPPETWRCKHCLPYGWEMAVDYNNTNYYINHIAQTVTYEDPRTEDDQTTSHHLHQRKLPPPDLLVHPEPREYVIKRDSMMGFGFIAGSEKPVVIRSVTQGGPSEDKLLPDDQILKIGNENVMQADRAKVIEMIRDQTDEVTLTVLQPNRSASSSFLNPVKKTFRTMDRPKVRFADDVIVNGQERAEGSSPLLMSPGVLRVELEDKETRSFRFNPDTTAGDAVTALCDQMGFKDPNLFSLVLACAAESEDICGSAPWDSLSKVWIRVYIKMTIITNRTWSVPIVQAVKVVNNPAVRHHYCYLRLEFMPRDFHKLARNDPESFRYLYLQCVNDVVTGDRYKADLSHEDFVKLAVLQMQELIISAVPATPPNDRRSSTSLDGQQKNVFRFSSVTNKLTLKYFEKEYGLKRFLPASVLDAMKKDHNTAKTVKKMIQQFLKTSSIFNQHATSPIIPTSPTLVPGGSTETVLYQLRLQYLKVLSPQHLFGGRFFSVSMLALMESDVAILVGHHYGISQMINTKTRMVSVLSDFQHVTGLEVSPSRADSRTTKVKIQFTEKKELLLSMEKQDAHNFAFMVAGYCRVYGNIDMVLTLPMAEATTAPMYFGPHKVRTSNWNYPSSGYGNSNEEFPHPPAYFYCDFSEPVTPNILSHNTPPLTNGTTKSIYPRPPTPPPSVENRGDSDDNGPVPVQSRVKEGGDTNNNDSVTVRKLGDNELYEEISPTLSKPPPLPPVSYTDKEETALKGDNTVEPIANDDGKRTDNSNIENFSDTEATCSESTRLRKTGITASLSSPPDYPTPRRGSSRKNVEEKHTASSEQNLSNGSAESDRASHVPSFKPSDDVVSPAQQSPPSPNAIGSPDTSGGKPLENFEDVKDPETIEKLREAVDLMEYFRQKHQEMVDASSDIASSADPTGSIPDLAAGNKRLRRAEKAALKNRKSWAGVDNLPMVEDQGVMSVSNPDLSSTPGHKKRNRSIFRKFFARRRKKPPSMYEPTGSAYGRRKRRFKMPRFRFKKAFSLKSSGTANGKSVLPDTNIDSKPGPSHFRLFGSKKGRSHGMLVISEPCDNVRGVDLLPSGKYTVAGSMFSGDNKESKVITLESKDNSLENLTEIGITDGTSSQSTSKVTMRPSNGSLRVSKRPVSFSTFQQSITENSNHIDPLSIVPVEEMKGNSLSLDADQASPCELSQTESTEALHEVAMSEPIHLSIVKPPRRSVRASNPISPTNGNNETPLPVDELPAVENSKPHDTRAESKKNPSYKRPVPPPPPAQLSKGSVTAPLDKEKILVGRENGDCTANTVAANRLESDLEDNVSLSEPISEESMSLVTEIFSYLKSNNDVAKLPELPDDTVSQSSASEAENVLLYDEGYSMPGVKSDPVMKVDRVEKSPETETRASEQRALYEMFYNEMIADNSRLTLEDPEEQCDTDSDVTDDGRQGSYDVTISSDSEVDGENASENNGVTLKYYASTERLNPTHCKQTNAAGDALPINRLGEYSSSTTDDSDIRTESESEVKDETDSNSPSSTASSSKYNVGRPSSYFKYQDLITPPRYSRASIGLKRIPLSAKPPVPPKPVFH